MSGLHLHQTPVNPQAWNAAQRFLDMQTSERPQNIVEARSFGPVSMMEVAQGAGSFPDEASSVFNLQTLISANCPAEISYGGQKLRTTWVHSGDICFAPANAHCNYLVSAPHVCLMIPIPLHAVNSVAQHVMPSFRGDFSVLHSRGFRSDAVRTRMYSLWRAAAGDAKAPSVDPHAESLALIDQLLRLSAYPQAIKLARHHLAPLARQRVLDYIDAHLADDVSLPKLAQVAGLSDYYFMRAFKAEMGITAHQYVLQQRIYQAIRLLRATRLTITQIAMDCGFASPQHMSMVFSTVRGRTPLSVRA
jgi:AraC-like DNA-binding protein